MTAPAAPVEAREVREVILLPAPLIGEIPGFTVLAGSTIVLFAGYLDYRRAGDAH